MDFISHALWAFLAARFAKVREWEQFVLFSVVPDVAFALPAVAVGLFWAVSDMRVPWEAASLAANQWWIGVFYHVAHSFLTLAVFVVVARLIFGVFPWPAAGGWALHLLMDLFTHKDSMTMPMPFYPFGPEVAGFVHWREPWFLAVDWLGLAFAYWLVFGRDGKLAERFKSARAALFSWLRG